MMRLKILLPTHVLVEQAVQKVIVEAENGSHALLPRHADFVTALAPGILSYWDEAGEHVVAVDGGTLVKAGHRVLVAAPHAVAGPSLAALRDTVAGDFRALDEHERQARTALARLEAAAMQRFWSLEEREHG